MATPLSERRSSRSSKSILPCPRSLKESQTIPDCMAEILVLWKVAENEVWWPATVMDCEPVSRPPVVAIGTVYYEKYGRHQEETAEVEFIWSKNDGRLLRLRGDDVDVLQANSWKFESEAEHEDVSVTSDEREQTFGGEQQYVSPFTTEDKDVTIVPKAASSVANIDSRKRRRVQPSRKAAFVSAQSSEINLGEQQESNRSQRKRKLDIELRPQDGNERTIRGEAASLFSPAPTSTEVGMRDCASLHEKVSKLYSKVEILQSKLHSDRILLTTPLNACLLLLKNDLLLRFSSLSQPPRWVFHGPPEGVYCHYIEVDVSCTLSNFSEVVARVQGFTDSIKADIRFLPTFDELIHPSLSAKFLTIWFRSMRGLCHLLRIREEEDFRQLVLRKGTAKTAPCLQVLGSAGRYSSVHDKRFLQVNRLVVGTSVIESRLIAGDTKLYPQSEDMPTNFPLVLQQELTSLDEVSGCYLAPWTRVVCNQGDPFDLDEHEGVNEALGHSIFLQWRPLNVPSSRRWSRDTLNVGHDALGSLSLSIPVVYCRGSRTCQQASVLVEQFLSDL